MLINPLTTTYLKTRLVVIIPVRNTYLGNGQFPIVPLIKKCWKAAQKGQQIG